MRVPAPRAADVLDARHRDREGALEPGQEAHLAGQAGGRSRAAGEPEHEILPEAVQGVVGSRRGEWTQPSTGEVGAFAPQEGPRDGLARVRLVVVDRPHPPIPSGGGARVHRIAPWQAGPGRCPPATGDRKDPAP